MRLLDAAQMHEADARGRERRGDVTLMREAGERIAETISLIPGSLRRIVAFAGPGDNGGDAFAGLASYAEPVERVVYAMDAREASAARLDAQARARGSGVISRPFPKNETEVRAACEGADLLVDALLGTGARPEFDAAMLAVVRALEHSRTPVLAIDVPTGVDASTGAVAEAAVRAAYTITLGALKVGLLVEPGRERCGQLYLGSIGTGEEIAAVSAPHVEMLGVDDFLALIPRRPRESDKRSAGAPLIVAGSAQFPGAAVLCAHGAARAGAGYVTVATEAEAAPALRSHLIEQVVVTYDTADPEAAIQTILDLTRRCTSVGIGPGLGLGEATGAIVRGVIERLTLPFVVDASALFHLGKSLELLRDKACVLTPHAGEFARLSGEGTVPPDKRRERLRAFVERTGVTTLLKGAATLIDDGRSLHVNPTGTPALATAGTGDVLTGAIATLLSQGVRPVDAARAAAFWHGRAGELAARERPVGVVASDVYAKLGDAFAECTRAAGGSGALMRIY